MWDFRNLGNRKFLYGNNVNVFILDIILRWENLKNYWYFILFLEKNLVLVKMMRIINLKNDDYFY